MSSSRTLARRQGHWLVTIYHSKTEYQTNSNAWRGAVDCLTNGEIITISDAAGNIFTYDSNIVTQFELTKDLSLNTQSVNILIYPNLFHKKLNPYDSFGSKHPFDYNLSRGFGEIAWVDENKYGNGIEQTWEDREIWLTGPISDYSWGMETEPVSITFKQIPLSDKGKLYPENSTLITNKFPDMGRTDSITDLITPLARNSIGLLYPIPIYTSKSSLNSYTTLKTPLLCVKDDINAVAGRTSYTPRRYLVSYEKIGTYDEDYVFFMNPDGVTTYYANPDYVTVKQDLDGLGARYYYIEDQMFAGFQSDVTMTNGLSTVTSGRSLLNLKPGDQIKLSSANNTYFVKVKTVDSSSSLTLYSPYQGPSGKTTIDVYRVPSSIAYVAYMSSTGIVDIVDNTRTIDTFVDMIKYLLFKASLTVEIDLGSLEAMRAKLSTWYPTTLINEDATPFDYLNSKVLPLLPIKPYISSGVLKFLWVGPHEVNEAITDIDLSDKSIGLFRTSPITVTPTEDIYNEIIIDMAWSVINQRYLYRLDVGGSETGNNTTGYFIPNARSTISQYLYENPGDSRVPYKRKFLLQTDMVNDLNTSLLIANNLIYQTSESRKTIELAGFSYWRWLSPGDIITIHEDNVLDSTMAMVISTTRTGAGDVKITVQTLPTL